MSARTNLPGRGTESVVFLAFERRWDVTLEDIELDWIDAMTKRLLKELNRQLAAVESRAGENASAAELLANARALASIQETVTKLANVKTGRETAIEARKARTPDAARNEIKRRVLKRPA